MLSNTTKKPFVVPTTKSTKASTPDSSKNFAKSTAENKTKKPAILYTAITPQTDKANTNQADINTTTTNKPSSLPSALHCTNSIKSHHLNSTTAGAMIARSINSELPFPQDKHNEVPSPNKSNSTQFIDTRQPANLWSLTSAMNSS
eukprot:2788605-Ditylum_brightwellii.AAC.1